MQMAQKITSMVLALRRKVNIKVRQPLQAIMIPAVDADQKKHIEAVKDLIMNEVNVKELRFVEGAGVLVKKVKCNFRTMGKKFGKLMKMSRDRISLSRLPMWTSSARISQAGWWPTRVTSPSLSR